MIDYSALFAVSNSALKAERFQMERYCDIGRLVSKYPEKDILWMSFFISIHKMFIYYAVILVYYFKIKRQANNYCEGQEFP